MNEQVSAGVRRGVRSRRACVKAYASWRRKWGRRASKRESIQNEPDATAKERVEESELVEELLLEGALLPRNRWLRQQAVREQADPHGKDAEEPESRQRQ